MTQEEFNEDTLKALTQLMEALKDMGKARDVMYQLIQLESSRVDSAEDRIDILMNERVVDDIAEAEITPKALIELGFEEMYQGVDFSEPGYIFYSLEIKGVGFYTSSTDEGEMWVKLDNSDFDIRSLRKLGDLITALNELS